jgi:hypothetical protein
LLPPAGLKKKLRDLMGEFSELRARIHEENRQVVERRVYAVTGQHLPEDDIDRMIETGRHQGQLAMCPVSRLRQQLLVQHQRWVLVLAAQIARVEVAWQQC